MSSYVIATDKFYYGDEGVVYRGQILRFVWYGFGRVYDEHYNFVCNAGSHLYNDYLRFFDLNELTSKGYLVEYDGLKWTIGGILNDKIWIIPYGRLGAHKIVNPEELRVIDFDNKMENKMKYVIATKDGEALKPFKKGKIYSVKNRQGYFGGKYIMDNNDRWICGYESQNGLNYFRDFNIDELLEKNYVEYNGEQWLVNDIDVNNKNVLITSLKASGYLNPYIPWLNVETQQPVFKNKTVKPEELRIVDFKEKSSNTKLNNPILYGWNKIELNLGGNNLSDYRFSNMSDYLNYETKSKETKQKPAKYKVAKQDFEGENVGVTQGQILILKDSHYRDINNNRVCEPDSFYDTNCLKDLEEILEKYDKVEYKGERGTIVGRNIYKKDEQISSIDIWVMFQYYNKLFINPCELKIIFDNKNKEQKPETMKEQLKNRKILTNGNKELNQAVYRKLRELLECDPENPHKNNLVDANYWHISESYYRFDCSPASYYEGLRKTELTLDELFKMQPEPQTPNIEVNGYKAKFNDDYVKFGCAEIDKDVFIDIAEDFNIKEQKDNYTKSNREICGFKIGDGWFTLGQIEEIAKYYEKK